MKVLLRTILFHRGLQHLDEQCRGERLCTYSEHDCSTRPLTRKQSRDIEAILEEFAEYIIFTTIASPHADAHTEPNGALPGKSAIFQGSRSIVYYSRHKLTKLRTASTQPPTCQDIPLLLAWRFHFAIEFAHEVCHALQPAKELPTSAFSTDLFFHNEKISEIGFVMERRVLCGHFGFVYGNGRLNGKETVRRHRTSGGVLSGLVGVPIWWEWPCAWLVKEYYASGNLALWGRKGWEERLGGVDVARRVFPEELERYFTKAFWEDGGSGRDKVCSKAGVSAKFRSNSDEVYEPVS